MAKTRTPTPPPARRAQSGPIHIKDLHPDPRNARRHTPRNIGMISDSLRAVGAGRSIVIDEHNEILAGNGLVEAAAEAGITKVQVVEADGETVIAVRRTGLTKTQKQQFALFDNRTAELAEWDIDVLKGLALDGLDLAPFEFDAGMLAEISAPENFPSVDENIETEHACPKCGYRWSGGQ